MDTNHPKPAAPEPPVEPPQSEPKNHHRHATGKTGKRSVTKEILSTVGILVAAVLLAIGLITYVFQSYQVDGPSMQQTLHNNDRLIVWKLPRTWARITGHQYVPKRGDIIIFTEDLSAYGQGSHKQLIKRVIGLPGDRVVVAHNTITIYNKQHPKGFQPDKTLPYGKDITEPAIQNEDVTLGPHQLFMCGDNRTNSLDSRFFGPINTSQVIGKLALRILPINDAQAF